MDSCFHAGESSRCHNHGPMRVDRDVQNCSSTVLSQSQIRCATHEKSSGSRSQLRITVRYDRSCQRSTCVGPYAMRRQKVAKGCSSCA